MNTLAFDVSGKISPEESELREWLRSNRDCLADRTSDEIAQLALFCGFDISVICMTLVNFRDAMAGSHLDNRAAFESWRFDMALEDTAKAQKEKTAVKELDLMPLWRELVANTVTGEVNP